MKTTVTVPALELNNVKPRSLLSSGGICSASTLVCLCTTLQVYPNDVLYAKQLSISLCPTAWTWSTSPLSLSWIMSTLSRYIFCSWSCDFQSIFLLTKSSLCKMCTWLCSWCKILQWLSIPFSFRALAWLTSLVVVSHPAVIHYSSTWSSSLKTRTIFFSSIALWFLHSHARFTYTVPSVGTLSSHSSPCLPAPPVQIQTWKQTGSPSLTPQARGVPPTTYFSGPCTNSAFPSRKRGVSRYIGGLLSPQHEGLTPKLHGTMADCHTSVRQFCFEDRKVVCPL